MADERRGSQQDGDAVGSDEARRPQKRRRVALACNACRIRKSRCNGGQPRCSLCEQQDFDCTYEASDAAANIIVRKEYLSGFEQRIKELEDTVKKHEELLNGNRTSSIPDDPIAVPNGTRQSSPSRRVRFDNGIRLNATEFQEFPPEETGLTDGMAISFADEEASGFFGQSSNIAFMWHITRAMVASGNRIEPHTPATSEDLRQAPAGNGLFNASHPASPIIGTSEYATGAGIYYLPPHHQTKDLIRQYFSNTGFLFPYIHEPTFVETYERMRAENFKSVRRTFLGLLNMVLAMTASASICAEKSAQDRQMESDVFYRRALELNRKQIFRGSSLEIVQYLLLMGQYLQSTQKSVETWTIHGLAVKAALSLGLHSRDASKRFSPLEQETRKRTWYACIWLDRNLSMTFGRPSAIPDDYVRLPLPVPLIDEQSTAKPGTNYRALSVHFFTSTITLFQIQHKVVALLYGQNLGCDPPLDAMEIVSKTLKLEQELANWQQTLPSALRIRSSSNLDLDSGEDPVVERLQIILTLRCLNIQVLLHRPSLMRALDLRLKNHHQQSSMAADDMLAGFIKTCIHAAEETVLMVHPVSTIGKAKGLLGAWWYSLYYTFNAALVIFGNILASSRNPNTPNDLAAQIESGRILLSKAAAAIQGLDNGNQIADRCSEYVERLTRMLEGWRTNLQNGNHANPDMSPSQQFAPPQDFPASALATDFDATFTADELDLSSLLSSDIELDQFFNTTEAGLWTGYP